MRQTATVNYHVHKPHRQAFELDAGGIVGNLIAPELAPTHVAVTDIRNTDALVRFEDASVGFAISAPKPYPAMRRSFWTFRPSATHLVSSAGDNRQA